MVAAGATNGDHARTLTAQERPMKKVTAIVSPELALIRIETFGEQCELVIEDDTDRACICLTPGIAREIIDNLSDWVASTTGPRVSITDEELAAAFRDVYAHIGVKP
jgi:hypothetical protein